MNCRNHFFLCLNIWFLKYLHSRSPIVYFVPRFITRLTPVIFGCSKSIFRFKKEKKGEGLILIMKLNFIMTNGSRTRSWVFPRGANKLNLSFSNQYYVRNNSECEKKNNQTRTKEITPIPWNPWKFIITREFIPGKKLLWAHNSFFFLFFLTFFLNRFNQN